MDLNTEISPLDSKIRLPWGRSLETKGKRLSVRDSIDRVVFECDLGWELSLKDVSKDGRKLLMVSNDEESRHVRFAVVDLRVKRVWKYDMRWNKEIVDVTDDLQLGPGKLIFGLDDHSICVFSCENDDLIILKYSKYIEGASQIIYDGYSNIYMFIHYELFTFDVVTKTTTLLARIPLDRWVPMFRCFLLTPKIILIVHGLNYKYSYNIGSKKLTSYPVEETMIELSLHRSSVSPDGRLIFLHHGDAGLAIAPFDHFHAKKNLPISSRDIIEGSKIDDYRPAENLVTISSKTNAYFSARFNRFNHVFTIYHDGNEFAIEPSTPLPYPVHTRFWETEWARIMSNGTFETSFDWPKPGVPFGKDSLRACKETGFRDMFLLVAACAVLGLENENAEKEYLLQLTRALAREIIKT